MKLFIARLVEPIGTVRNKLIIAMTADKTSTFEPIKSTYQQLNMNLMLATLAEAHFTLPRPGGDFSG